MDGEPLTRHPRLTNRLRKRNTFQHSRYRQDEITDEIVGVGLGFGQRGDAVHHRHRRADGEQSEACEQRRAKGFYDSPRVDEARYNALLFRWGHPKIARLCDAEGVPYPELDEDGQVKDSAALTALLRKEP